MDTIRYCTKYSDTIRYTVTKRSAVYNGQQSKINAAFSLRPSHMFACVQRPGVKCGCADVVTGNLRSKVVGKICGCNG